MNSHLYSVIIAGGKGTRFWPLSRTQRPKQLLRILSQRSLIRETANRAIPLSGRDRTLVVTVEEQLTPLRKELPMLARNNFLAEPHGNNTAPCVGLAAVEVAMRDPGAIMMVLPADHWVADTGAFRKTLKAAAHLAIHYDHLITIGVRPDYPETGYGYIVKGKPIEGNDTALAYHVKKFTEKPPLAEAQRLMRQGSFWNSGIFVWKASTLLELLGRYQPTIKAGLDHIGKAARGKPLARPELHLRSVIAREYKKLPNISIDHAVLEKAGSEGRVLTLEASFGWSDVGSWDAVHRMMRRDAHGNAGKGKWLGIGAKNCLVHAQNRLVVLLGIRDAAVVDTPDALLVADLKRSQEVRELVEELKKKGYGAYTV